MAGFFPVFCKGKVQTITATVTAASTTIPLVGAATYFTAGNHVFASAVDESDLQYLGKVMTVATNSFTVSLAPIYNGARIWRPSTVCNFQRSPGLGTIPSRDLGVSIQQSRGGVPYVTATADPIDSVAMTWTERAVGDIERYRAFIAALRNGADPFTAAWYDWTAGAQVVARVFNASRILTSTPGRKQFETFSISLIIAARGEYVS
jgi:hypothetical protein